MDKIIETYIRQIVEELDCEEEEKNEIAEEMKSHLILLKAEYISEGFSEEESTKKAIQIFGSNKTIKEGFQHSLFPYYKIFKRVNWLLFGLYSIFLLTNLLFLRILWRIINYNSTFNKYFYYPESSTFFDIDTWIRNSNVIPFKSTYGYIMGSDRYNLDIIMNNTIGNILLFVPLGIFLPILFKKYKTFSQVFAFALLFSISIELLQFFLQIGQFDIDDIILNTMGSIIGYFIIKLIVKIPMFSRWNVFRKTTS